MGATVTLEAAAVAAAVRRGLGDPAAVPLGWTVHAIAHPIAAATSGVYRVAGTAALRGRPVDWSLVLKVTAPPPGAAAPRPDWRREALAYASGLLADLPAGLTAPRCFGVEGADATAAGPVRLWLEDLAAGGAQGPPFTPAQYRRLARGLGALAGAYPGRRPLPAHPWLRRGDARREHAAGAGRLATLEALAQRADPWIQRGWPPDVRARVLDGFAAAPALLAALEALPHSLGHQDAVPRNLFLRPDGAAGPAAVVAIDWAQVGLSPVGRDLAYLVAGGIHASAVAPAALPAVEAAALEGYLEGLADQGWRGAARDVRLGYLLSVGLRYGLLTAPLMLTGDAQRRQQIVRSFGRPLEALADVFREEQRFSLDRLDEARTLLRAAPG